MPETGAEREAGDARRDRARGRTNVRARRHVRTAAIAVAVTALVWLGAYALLGLDRWQGGLLLFVLVALVCVPVSVLYVSRAGSRSKAAE
jgi:hypothetical protein